MNKVLKLLDLLLLRIIPILILLFIIFSLALESFEYFRKENILFVWRDFDSYCFVFCFIILGLSSAMSYLNISKLSIIFKFSAIILALIFVALSILEILIFLLNSTTDTPNFLNYYIPKIQQILNILAAVFIIVSCLLKDKFKKTKLFFAILTVFLILLTYQLPKLYLWLEFNDTTLFKFSFWEILLIYAEGVIIIISQFSPTQKQKG